MSTPENGPPPPNTIGVLTIVAEAEVIPGEPVEPVTVEAAVNADAEVLSDESPRTSGT